MLVVSALKSLTNLFPSQLRTEVENDLPALSLAAGRLGAVVDALNAKLGREWVNYGIHILEAALSKALPPGLTALISIVHQAAQIGFQRRLFSAQKRMVAVQLVRANARA